MPKATKKSKPIGEMIDEVFALREKKRKLEAEVKAIEADIEANSAKIVERLDAEKTDSARSRQARVFITESVVPNVTDWEKFMREEVVKNGHIHLVERRPAVLGCREIFEMGGSIKGLEPYTKRKLNIRSINEK